MKNNKIIINLNNVYDQNKSINTSLNSRYLYSQLRKNDLMKTKIEIEQQIRKNNIKFEWPGKLKFIWYLTNFKRDPDNISSAGRKVILDAMQKATYLNGDIFLKNDSLKYIKGFVDEFIVNRQLEYPFVEIYFDKS